ncbi:MAG: hypothetical protein JXA03_09085 [Bacteroidales bacterium]|nr:hypothetical protein [Bacteroidales bacterium]
MKRVLLLGCFSVLLAFSISAQKSWTAFISETPGAPAVSITEQTGSRLVLDISIPGMYVSEVNEELLRFQRIELTEGSTTQEVGKPELPVIHQLIGFPGNQLAKVNILNHETVVLTGYHVYPFQTPTTDNPGGAGHDFVIDKAFYADNKVYPGNQVTLDRPGIWRDVRVAGLHIVPFSYNPANGELVATTRITLEIEFYGYDSELTLNRDNFVSPMFYRLYESNILNFASLGMVPEYKGNDDIKYLIITNTNALASIQPLVDWKNQQGFRVEVKTMAAGFNTPANFKTYISQLFTSDDLEYVLMVGDAYPNGGNGGGPDDVPMYWWAPSGEDPSYSDSWYTCLNGPDDHYADLAIGRFVYDNLTELSLQIQKTISHYFNPDISNWARNSILVAHKEQYPGKYTQCCEEIRTFPYALQTPVFEQAYGGAGYTNDQVVNYVNNNSCGIFNYRGHGSATELWQWCNQGSFTASHVNQLTNTNRLFVFFDVCCDNMDIVAYSGNCLCESFMKSPVASVAVNGAIIPSYTIPNHDYDKEMYKAVFNEGIYNIGYVTNFANVTVLNVHGTIGRSNVRTYLWLGDASLEPWTLQPANMTVNHNPTLFLGMSEFSVSVIGSGGPLGNAMVCVSNADQSIYGVAFTNASGNATVVFSSPVQNPGTVKVTVTAHNHLPYQADVPVIPQSGPYVVSQGYTINDATGGNGDGLMDYGESILLSVGMKNVGITPATNVVVTLSTGDSYITFTDNTENYGTINPEQTVEIAGAFAFDVANNIPDGHYVVIDVEANGDGKTLWTSSISVEGHAPVLEFTDFVVSDPAGNNNGILDPGESGIITVTVENTGSSAAFNVSGVLQESDPYITLTGASQNYGTIAGGVSVQRNYNVTAASNTPIGHTADFNLVITADLGITGIGAFNIVIGQIPVLIVDLDDNHNSGPAMQTAIQNNGVTVNYTTTFPDAATMDLYSSLFVCLGIYSNNHVLTSAQGQALAAFLNGGGKIYMEGGDTWYYDSQTAVHPMFKISAVGDGSGDMGTVLGQTGTFTEGMSFTYTGENNWMDRINPVSPAVAILKNLSPSYGTGVAYDGGSYMTIGTSHEFGGLANGAFPSTRDELMKQYLDFFGLLAPPVPPAPQIDLKVFLEGPFSGSMMMTWLKNYGYLPLSQPYNAYPWFYTGTEAVTAIPNNDIVDWVLVELRETSGPAGTATGATTVASQAGFLLKNGDIVSADGASLMSFNITITQNLYAVVWHRSHLGVMSNYPLTLTDGTWSFDYTTGANQAYGGHLGHKELAPGIWGMYSGDGNSNGQVSSSDKIEVWVPQTGQSGYKQGDYNMNGTVDNTDKIDFWAPNAGCGKQVPF